MPQKSRLGGMPSTRMVLGKSLQMTLSITTVAIYHIEDSVEIQPKMKENIRK